MEEKLKTDLIAGVFSLGLAALLLSQPRPEVEITPNLLGMHDFRTYDLNNDGKLDAIGYKTTSSLRMVAQGIKDRRIDGFTRVINNDELKVIRKFYNN